MSLENQPPAEEIIIRDAVNSDVDAIAEIYNESIAVGDATMDDEPKTSEYYLQQMAGFHKREALIVLEISEEVKGWGIIKRYSDRVGYRFCCETAVYLRRHILNRGYGAKIKTALIERCRQMGYHHLVAKIFADNEASIKYNEKFGYEIVGRQRQIGFKNGRWQDIIIMQLIIDDIPPKIPQRYQ